jgi:hypothetical protein
MHMRTTVTLPDDLHEQTMALARDEGRTFSNTVAMLLRRSLSRTATPRIVEGPHGLLVSVDGLPLTAEDVRALDDD